MSNQGLHKYRSLANLEKTGSTSRVLNLGAIARAKGHLADHAATPLLRSRVLNRALVIKHRLRAEDGDIASALRYRGTATKVVLPFERSDLGLGGSALFVGQPGWIDMLAQVAGPGGPDDIQHDQHVLEALDELPSLDPFMIREHLRRKRLKVADCYFDLPPGDLARMEAFVAREVFPLVGLAHADPARTQTSAGTLARMLLGRRPDERLRALRDSLRLEDENYSDGIYAWKGFLFYKWLLETLKHPLQELVIELGRLQVLGPQAPDVAAVIATARGRVQATIQTRWKEAGQLIARYDRAFARLSHDADIQAFREFLLASPILFLELGERTGTLSHTASYWRYSFPVGVPPAAGAEDILDLLQEFEVSLAQAPPTVEAA